MPLPELSLQTLSSPADFYLLRYEGDDGKGEKFILDAPYQRGAVWTTDQQRALIKSMLMHLPVGNVVLAQLPYKEGRCTYRVIDGQQRIRALRAFVAGEFHIPADWLPDRSLDGPPRALTNVRWEDLSKVGQRKLENAQLPAFIFDSQARWVYDPTHPKAVARKNDWYTERRTEDEMLAAEAELFGLLNGGGTAQTPETMAHAAELAKGSIQ